MSTPFRPRATLGIRRRKFRRPVRRVVRRPATVPVVAALLLLLAQVGGLAELVRDPTAGPDYFAAAAFVAKRHQPGEPVIVAIPPPAYLALGSTADMVFLPSPLEANRAQRYTRLMPSGEYVDYWLGVPSIVSTAALCRALDAHPAPWLIVDEMRLGAANAYAGSMADVIRGRTSTVYIGKGDVSVRRPTEGGTTSDAATLACAAQPSVIPAG